MTEWAMPEVFLVDGATKDVLSELTPGRTLCEPGAVQEARTFYFEIRDIEDPRSAAVLIDDELIEGPILAANGTARWRWDPGFYAGEVNVEVRAGPRSVMRTVLITDPELRKLTRDQYDTMVREILEDTFALFALSAHRVPIGRGSGQHRPPIARLEFLWSRVAEIESAVAAIDRNPLRNLRAEQDLVPLQRARQVTPRELMRSLSRGRVERAASPELNLPQELRGFALAQVYKTRKTTGLDTREHRDIKVALRTWAHWLRVVADRFASTASSGHPTRLEERWAGRCVEMARRLDALLLLPLFTEVGDNTGPLHVTPAYRRLPSYQRFFSAYRDFQLGISNVLGSFLALPLARTWELYEVWAFLRLARAASTLFPSAAFNPGDLFSASPGALTVMTGAVCVDFASRVRLCFKRSYREFWLTADRRGSYSREMIPDLSLETIPKGEALCLVVLDAKYRVGEGLNDALASIHMYRDALVSPVAEDNCEVSRIVAGAYLVTPDAPLVPKGAWEDAGMPVRLFHPAYRACFRYGAITLRPGVPVSMIAGVLQTVINDTCEQQESSALNAAV